MRGRLIRVLGALLAVGMVASCLLFLPPMLGISGAGEMDTRQASSDATRAAKGILLLAEPAFAEAGITFLEEEAGISAWTRVAGGIDLARARAGFKTIERQTDEYILGTVGLPGLPETDDVHVFVHRTGWMAAYYLRGHPTAKIVDWNNLAVTKPEQALGAIGIAAGVRIGEVKYYDFRYPDADGLMVIIDNDSFRLKIPMGFMVYERSYSFWATSRRWEGDGDQGGWLTIEGTDIIFSRAAIEIGTLTATQLRSDVFQTVGVRYGGHWKPSCRIAIVLVYGEP